MGRIFEVTASPFKNKTDYVGVEKRFVFETLSQAYIALSIYQGLAINNGGPTLFHYASRLPGYMDKISGVLDYLCNYTPVTIRVPQDYPIIQQAVNAALHGDTIIVSAGEYQENIVANSKNNVTIRGVIADPDNPLNSGANTVINGNKKQVINLGSSNGIVLDSLVITAGVPFDHNTDYSISAGGVYCTGENVVIKNNIILNNKGYSGAGICAIGRNVRIENNLIKDNNASSGGGVYVSAGSGGTAVVCKNKILNNHSWSAGGGLYINSGNVSVYQNIVFGNCSDSSAGMYLFLITGEINNNIIAQNYTECFSGGGIYCDNSAILIANNVIYRNSAISWPQSKCGGVYISGTNTPIVKNNIITENYKGGIYYNGTSTCLLTYNDVYSNTNDGDNYNGCSAGEGAISSQPLFVSPDNGDGD
ncbi:MAG: right-handed parallel beta-helix repeat-containing protein [Candidatus Omnitrophica bacterium]|nr:right-handed parallel beta-helix repeat-containing protein [Candidatus Omnitrophota bacterium]